MATRREILGGGLVALAAGPAFALPPRGFVMSVEDAFNISGVGVVAVGRVERGVLRPGDALEAVGLGATLTTGCRYIDRFRQRQAEATVGQDVGVALTGVTRDQIKRGQVLCSPGAIRPAARFEAEVSLAAEATGGRRTPLADGYRPLVRIRTASVPATVALGRGVVPVAPGGKGRVVVTLEQPLALEPGLAFAFMDGGRVVGSGVISRVSA